VDAVPPHCGVFGSSRSSARQPADQTRSWCGFPKSLLDERQLPPDYVLNTYAGYLPFWRPSGALPDLYRIRSDKAYRVGWQTRPFNETTFDCLSHFRSYDTSASPTPALQAWTDRLSRNTELAGLDTWQHHSA